MIGIFDSGVGGLGIYKEVKKIIPNESILYLADSVNCPYGEKTQKEIKKIALDNTKFLIGKGCNIIVIACNTASTIALEYVRKNISSYTSATPEVAEGISIIGVVPVVKTAAKVSKNKRVGILATKKTVESEYLHNLIEQFCPSYTKVSEGEPQKKVYRVYYQEANELVELVEASNYSSTRMKFGGEEISSRPASRQGGQARTVIKKYLQPFIKAKVDIIALGCTHFPFLREEIQEIMGPKVTILDSNGAVARQVARITNDELRIMNYESRMKKQKTIDKIPKYQFFTSGNPEKVKLVMEKLLDEKIDRVEKK